MRTGNHSGAKIVAWFPRIALRIPTQRAIVAFKDPAHTIETTTDPARCR